MPKSFEEMQKDAIAKEATKQKKIHAEKMAKEKVALAIKSGRFDVENITDKEFRKMAGKERILGGIRSIARKIGEKMKEGKEEKKGGVFKDMVEKNPHEGNGRNIWHE